MANVQVNDKIEVTIVKHPRSAGARKTLIQLLSRDAKTHKHNNVLADIRKKNLVPKWRGGRFWGGWLKKKPILFGKVGEKGTFVVTPEVARILPSVEQFVEIKKA